ncbi:MAG: OsmC family protein [Actinobacteria bacterium]|nr:OsmC family protein [Actinomycetota bacterium]
MATRAKTFSYAVSLDRDWAATSDEGGPPLPVENAWSPEHLLLAGLARCSLTSLGFHARRDGLELSSSADASAQVTRREEDGRYAFVEIGIHADVTLTPAPANVRELLAKAERDCFVGASLTVEPRYSWTVNGEEVR